MKLQLFINGSLFKERFIYDIQLSKVCTKSKKNVEERKDKIDWYIANLKEKYITEIFNSNTYEILLVVESKMNNNVKVKPVVEQVILPKSEVKPIIKMQRPEAKYSNKGYLSLTGS